MVSKVPPDVDLQYPSNDQKPSWNTSEVSSFTLDSAALSGIWFQSLISEFVKFKVKNVYILRCMNNSDYILVDLIYKLVT